MHDLRNDPRNAPLPWRAWSDAAGVAEVDAGLRGCYAALEQAVAAKGPTCWLSGKCCNFDAYGHKLYVTGLEIAWCLQQLGIQGRAPLDPHAVDPGGACPFQVDKLCSVRAVRPLGCRIYFCQKGTEAWQHELYEDFLGAIKRLHERHGLAYSYMEWRQGLIEASEAMRTAPRV